ncbi:MAG: YceI family protein [Longimicrobiales bacterium]
MSTTQQQIGMTTWQIDPAHSEIGFSVKHMMVTTVRGRFQNFAARIELNEQDPAQSKISVEIDVASVDTREQQRDDHLRSADFFDVANHPTMTFVARNAERVSGDRYRVVGDLTIRGVMREVVLDAEITGRGKDPWGGERLGVSATTRINRGDYGLKWNVALETGGILVAEEVKINLEVQLIRK